jgi:mutator protein MutT
MGGVPPPRAISVVAAVIEREGKILITRRPAGSHLAGLWEFPGGKSQPGESDREALARELREELGVSATVGEPVEVVEWRYPDIHVRSSSSVAPSTASRARSRARKWRGWRPPSSIATSFPPADAVLLERLRRS